MCWERRQQDHLRSGLIVGAALLVVGLLAALAFELGEATQVARLGLLFLALEVGCLVLHELGHAFVGWFLGFRLYRMSFGYGPVLLARRVGDVLLEVHSYPVCGFVEVGSLGAGLARIRHALVALGGPAANAGLGLLAWSQLHGEWPEELAMHEVNVWHLLLVVNALVLFFNLIPFAYPSSDDDREWQANDGLQALRDTFASPTTVARWQLAALRADALRHLEGQRDEEAAHLVARGMERFPGAVPLRLLAATLATRRGAWPEAEQLQREILAEELLPDAVRAQAMSGLARTLLEQGALDEAERVSQSALQLRPGDLEARRVRGEALLARGYVAQAEVLFRGLLGGADEPGQRAEFSCLLAEARVAAHDREGAAQLIEEARRLDPSCRSIAALEERLQRLSGQ